jgi:glycerophosphoryl diester phosphodiesterase
MYPIRRNSPLQIALALLAASCAAVAQGADVQAAPAQDDATRSQGQQGHTKWRTLNREAPLVIAHRGASAYFPEETIEAYALAIAMGVDAIEPDLVVSKDGVLVARHDLTLDASTNVAQHPEFAARKRAGENGDGEPVAADWFISDFTLAELKTLGARSPNHPAAKVYDGLFRIATFQEILELIKRKESEAGFVVAVYPETKNPSYHLALWKNGQIPSRMEDTLVAMIKSHGLNRRDAPIFVQSFEPSSLQYMRSIGSKVRQVQLIDAYDIDFKSGAMIYGTDAAHRVYSQPTDWKLAGRNDLFDTMLTPAGLAQIRTYADGIGPWKPYIMSWSGTSFLPPTNVVADAHRAGLVVHPYTFRNEASRQPPGFGGNPVKEHLRFYELGVDVMFSDYADTAFAARAMLLLATDPAFDDCLLALRKCDRGNE